MASGTAYMVFVVPAVFTVIFGSTVLASTLDEMDRELNWWPSSSALHGSHLSIEVMEIDSEQGEVLFQMTADGIGKCENGALVDACSGATVTIDIMVHDSAGNLVGENTGIRQDVIDGNVGMFSAGIGPAGEHTLTATLELDDQHSKGQLTERVVFQVE